ncbi:hypothetical protein E2C01_076655 [Portunus trituberculatus]|uniref:Uncharacterized protein n=1 Tax=Portunus trituberculatus TaxID=210409 RepID=A0A5B7IDR5_PORTR|nr:hypothetical protein [Portunus trituberculatus]
MPDELPYPKLVQVTQACTKKKKIRHIVHTRPNIMLEYKHHST